MASGRVFTANVILARTPGGAAEQFKIGDDVPEWAINKVGDHASQGVTRAAGAPVPAVTPVNSGGISLIPSEPTGDEDEDDEDSYTTWNKAELKDEAKGREIEGFSKMSKDELVAALEADDEANTEE